MSTIKVATNFNIDIEFAAPPFYRRLVAWVIDMVVLIFYVVVASNFRRWIFDNMDTNDDTAIISWAVSMMLVLPFLLYHVVLEITMNGQSIGKKIMGIKVVSENGSRPSISQFIIRWLIRTSDYMIIMIIIFLPYAFAFGPIVYWSVAGAFALLIIDLVLVNTRKQQRLGDILAHTVLIDIKERGKITDTVFLEVEESYVPQFPQIMQLSDRDINSLKGIIDAARKHKDHHMAYMAAEKIKSHLKIDTYLEPEDFLEVLLKDYNYLSAN